MFEGTAKMYFVADGKVFVVDEIAPDDRYRFIGYHAFDQDSRKNATPGSNRDLNDDATACSRPSNMLLAAERQTLWSQPHIRLEVTT